MKGLLTSFLSAHLLKNQKEVLGMYLGTIFNCYWLCTNLLLFLGINCFSKFDAGMKTPTALYVF